MKKTIKNKDKTVDGIYYIKEDDNIRYGVLTMLETQLNSYKNINEFSKMIDDGLDIMESDGCDYVYSKTHDASFVKCFLKIKRDYKIYYDFEEITNKQKFKTLVDNMSTDELTDCRHNMGGKLDKEFLIVIPFNNSTNLPFSYLETDINNNVTNISYIKPTGNYFCSYHFKPGDDLIWNIKKNKDGGIQSIKKSIIKKD